MGINHRRFLVETVLDGYLWETTPQSLLYLGDLKIKQDN